MIACAPNLRCPPNTEDFIKDGLDDGWCRDICCANMHDERDVRARRTSKQRILTEENAVSMELDI